MNFYFRNNTLVIMVFISAKSIKENLNYKVILFKIFKIPSRFFTDQNLEAFVKISIKFINTEFIYTKMKEKI